MDMRSAILKKNFESIYAHGFQATRTDKVILSLGITKGAFYHYFPDKYSMGYAIVEEIIYPMFVGNWENAYKQHENSVEALLSAVQHIQNIATVENIGLGCPLNNLIQEMSTIDEAFRVKLAYIIEAELVLITRILEEGIAKKQIKASIHTENTACFILAGIEGSFALGKAKNSLPTFQASMQVLTDFLQNLKV